MGKLAQKLLKRQLLKQQESRKALTQDNADLDEDPEKTTSEFDILKDSLLKGKPQIPDIVAYLSGTTDLSALARQSLRSQSREAYL